jgi:hypothetical protein
LIDLTTGKTLVEKVLLADGFLGRFLGLQFRRRLPPGVGMLLVPCRSVHTCFVRFPIDLAYIDRHGRVLAVRKYLPPWRAAVGAPGTFAILETPAGDVEIAAGQLLALQPTGDPAAALPCSVRFLSASRAM